MRIKFDFGDLEAFVATAEYGSFQRAANELNISQSALTRRIQKLELALGVTLIERTTRSMKLTLAAKGFRSRAVQLVEEAREAVQAVGDDNLRFDHQKNATVAVAAVPTATHNILPSAIASFRQAGHAARVIISDLSANDVLESVQDGDSDFGINFIGAQEPGLDFRILMDDQFVLALNRRDPLAKQGRVRWADINEDRFIAVWKGSGNRMLIDGALARSRQTLRWTYEVRHLSTALALVEANVGMTALPASAVPASDHPLVVSRPLGEPDVWRTIGTVRRAGSRLSPAAEAFFETLIKLWSIRRTKP
ncbi:MAG: LysR family transcriptional regulator [Hyphomicrobiaceae bacterium]